MSAPAAQPETTRATEKSREAESSKVDEEKGLSPVEQVVFDDERFQRDQDEGVDEIYELKSEMINACMQREIGMGRYQWELFFLSGLGWAADNIWLQGVAIILPEIGNEFVEHKRSTPWITFSLYIGLILGATTWGILADIIGRRLSWNITLFLAGVFGIAAGGSPNFVALGALVACLGFGVGGNLPVDGALFLEFIPQSHQWLLTALSAFWSLGQLIASLIAWGFISSYSCADPTVAGNPPCERSQNNGWRYTFYVLGVITFLMWVSRYIIFSMQESPKFLIANGRDEEAVKVLEYIAKKNGATISLTLEKLKSVERAKLGVNQAGTNGDGAEQRLRRSKFDIVKSHFTGLSLSHIRPLFSTARLATNTSIIIAIWGLIGLAYPLFNAFLPTFLAQRSAAEGGGVNTTYRNYSIISVLGIPGSIIACITVDLTRRQKSGNGSGWTFGGRKLTMAVSTALTGVFLFLFTTAKGNAGILGYNCVTALTQNAMYGVIYAYTPEVFPAPHRGTGDALCSAFNRVTGLMAPIIGLYADLTTSVPIYVSAALFLVTSILMLCLPIETAGKAAL